MKEKLNQKKHILIDINLLDKNKSLKIFNKVLK